MPFLVFRRDHLRSTSGIICGSGSFAVQFGDHSRSGDHLRSGIICGAVQGRFCWFLTDIKSSNTPAETTGAFFVFKMNKQSEPW